MSRAKVAAYVAHLALVVIAALFLTRMRETHQRRQVGDFVLPRTPRTHRRVFLGAALVGLGGLSAFGLPAGLTQAFLENITAITAAGFVACHPACAADPQG